MTEVIAPSGISVCKRCFGRCFAKMGYGVSNEERGIRYLPVYSQTLADHNISIVDDSKCDICGGIFLHLHELANLALEVSRDFQYSTFLVGSSPPEDALKREETLQSVFGETGESLRKEFNREVGKIIWAISKKETDFTDPDITFHYDLQYLQVTMKIRSIFVYGVYRKYVRGIPQTRWIHSDGNGTSVEQIIGEILKTQTSCDNYFLHGAGREDVDVRMLGNGREFIIEASNPRKREISLQYLMHKVNESRLVEIADLKVAQKSMVPALKASEYDKSYRAEIASENVLDAAKLEAAVNFLSGKDIYQRTPLRVSTRRSDLVRKKHIREIRVENVSGNVAFLVLRAQSGTYIKEFIHGDEGRTNPSLAEVYGSPLTVKSLDVIWIHR